MGLSLLVKAVTISARSKALLALGWYFKAY